VVKNVLKIANIVCLTPATHFHVEKENLKEISVFCMLVLLKAAIISKFHQNIIVYIIVLNITVIICTVVVKK
jgi:hypothetical protein